MEYVDLESGIPAKSTSIRRKWNMIPRIFRSYIILGLIFIFALIFAYAYLMPNQSDNSAIQQSNNERLKSQVSQTEKFIANDESNLEHKEYNEKHKHSDKNLLTFDDFKQASLHQNSIQKKIQDAIRHSWIGYRRFSWGQDHLKPVSKSGQNWFHIGLTILDSLDTLLMAGLETEYNEGLKWVQNDLNFNIYQEVNCFETTIRALGGLLSAYHLKKDDILLERADDLGSRLIHCFDSPSQTVPFSDLNLKTKTPKAPRWSSDSSLSEVSTMQLEFRDLTYETKNDEYEKKSFATSIHIHELVEQRNDPLLPMYINPVSGQLSPAVVTLGARADSYYEYLYKQYRQIKKDFLLEDYIKSIAAIKDKLLKHTKGDLKLAFIGELYPNNRETISPKMDHLVCFLSGTLTLGYHHEYDPQSPNKKVFLEHLELAEDLARTCNYMYNLTQTGLAPEIAYFGINEEDKEYSIHKQDTHNLLRPEFVESLFFLYHITGKPIYREWGLQIFNAFEKYCRVPSGGYTTINDVENAKNVRPRDMMESFWIAETLKYLYLLFLDDKKIVNSLLDNYIFNSEGHLMLKRVK